LNNDFMVAGISTSLVTALVYALPYLWNEVRKGAWASILRLYVTVDVDHSGLYRAMATWLADTGALDTSASYKALPNRVATSDADAMASTRPGKGGGKGRGWQSVSAPAKSYSLTPSDVDVCFLPMGRQETYRVMFEGRPVWITLTAENELRGPRRPGSEQDRIRIQALNVAGIDGRGLIRRLLVAVQTLAMRASENHVDLWHCVRTSRNDVEWEIATTIPKRKASTVVLDDGVMDDLLKDIAKFVSREEWYTSRNIPHRRGYLLEGPPGCGKSSLIRVVASEFNLPLCCVQLKSSRVGEGGIEALLQKAPEGAIIFIEDIDCCEQGGVASRTGKSDSSVAASDGKPDPERVTMSELLNAIDGLGAQTGRLLFLTTNHPERLDEALVRDGRIDRRYHLGKANQQMAKRIFLSICTEECLGTANDAQAEQFAKTIREGLSMAEIQGFLVRHHEKTFEEIMALTSEL